MHAAAVRHITGGAARLVRRTQLDTRTKADFGGRAATCMVFLAGLAGASTTALAQEWVNFVEESEVDSRKAEVIEITAEGEGSVRLWVASDSGELLRSAYPSTSMQGAPVGVIETYSDYREVDGFHLPFKTLIEQDGKKFADMIVEEVIFNSGLDAETLGGTP